MTESWDRLMSLVDIALTQAKRTEREAKVTKQALARIREHLEHLRSEEDARNEQHDEAVVA